MGHARQWFVDFIQIYDGRKVRGGEGGGSGRGSGGGWELEGGGRWG